MSFLGSIGKAIGGAISGFLGSGGNPVGAILGGIGGLLSGSGGGGGGSIGTYIPPTSQEAYNIIKGLEGQVGNIATTQYNIEKPYLDEALSIFRNFPDTLSQLFGDTESEIAERYASLFDTIQNQINNQWSKSALGLSALGMYNTPATQLTQADIVNELFGKIAEEEAQALNQLDVDKMKALIEYYNNALRLLPAFGETYANISPDINKYLMLRDLAGILNGLNVAIYPKTSPLAQVGQMINTALLLNGKNLPSWDSVINGIRNIFNGSLNFA